MSILEVSNGFGKLLPHQIEQVNEFGLGNGQVIEITEISQLTDNITSSNGLLQPTEWPVGAVLPNNQGGNHFIYARFTQPLDPASILTPAISSGVANNLTGNIQVIQVDPLTGVTTIIPGRAFVGGQSYGPTLNPDSAGDLVLEQWVAFNETSGRMEALEIDPDPNVVGDEVTPGLGFPGTESSFGGDNILADPQVFVFVVDTNGDLTDHETFPAGVQIQMRLTEGIFSTSGRNLQNEGLASSTVGEDTIPPEVLVSGVDLDPVILPGNDEIDVDPETNIEVSFTEPIQILTLGEFDNGSPPTISAAIQLQFGPPAGKVDVPYTLRPFSVFDLSRFELVPSFNFPGSGPPTEGANCNGFSTVDVIVNTGQFEDLSANVNTLAPTTSFTTAEGPGLINAPVTPDVIYVGRGGSTQAISVIDLHGFGLGPGNPTYDFSNPILEGNTNAPNNPNVSLQGTLLIPPISQGTCTFDGGSEGVFSLAKDSALRTELAGFPLLESVGDMALGHSLDQTFNNALPFGCQAGGGNICASTGLKVAALAAGGANSLTPGAAGGAFNLKIEFGAENLVSWGPHPNPPPLVFPPLCSSPQIGALEPTSVATPVSNLLSAGPNSLGSPEIGRPPTDLLASSQNVFFQGPSPPAPNISGCLGYALRQQIGHFLYVVDRVAGEIVVFNSNRFTVIDRIRLPDPTGLAMSPNLDFLAVTNQNADQVSFIDTDPSSSSFHQIVKTTRVGIGPTGIAWDPGNEDILVCNENESTVSVISAFSLNVRKVLRNQLFQPFDVVMTPRQLGFGFMRGVSFGYILNKNGRVALFESGPDGINGWGFDDIVGSLPFEFQNPKAISVDVTRINSAVWVVHENPLDAASGALTGQTGGAVSSVGISAGVMGIIPLSTGLFGNPSLRDLQFGLFASIGEGSLGLSGVPVDIAFDNQVNQTSLTNFATAFSSGEPLSINGKSLVKGLNGTALPTSTPSFMFLAVPEASVVDVLDVSTGTIQRVDTNVFEPGTQSIEVPGAVILMDFMRQ